MKLLESLEKLSLPKLCLALFMFALVWLIPNLGLVHLFDWDEINFAECAREMLVSGDYLTVQIDFKPFWEKPPFFIWLQALSMKLFGVNEFAARFPNAIAGAISMVLLFLLGNHLHHKKFGILWSFSFLGCLLPQFYFHSGIIDPWFNFFIFTSLVTLYFFVFEKASWSLLLASAFSGGLAILTKGPAALIVLGGTSFVLALFFPRQIFQKWLYLFGWLFLVLLVGGAWFFWLYLDGKSAVIQEFIHYQIRLFQTGEAGHAQPWYYHPVVLLIGCFPLSIPFLANQMSIFKTGKEWFKQPFQVLMFAFFWFSLILFSLATTKIVHYSSLCYYSITYFGITYLLQEKQSKWVAPINLTLGLVWALILFAIPIAGSYIQSHYQQIVSSGIIRDAFALENLKAEPVWDWLDYLPFIWLSIALGVSVFLYLKNKLLSSFVTQMLGITLALPLILGTFLAKIEAITQGAVIEFYQSKQNQNIEIRTMAYKSYAPYFYAQKGNLPKTDTLWMAKSTAKQELQQAHSHWKVVWEKNGFVAFQTKH
ncbi:MAG: glycosyltransferase family 39 protein [Bacteroidia bacterium]|nr:glycosyltransferase family 39 protein [Bacteroidia bacterium]